VHAAEVSAITMTVAGKSRCMAAMLPATILTKSKIVSIEIKTQQLHDNILEKR
jgi:hypothetical protein